MPTKNTGVLKGIVDGAWRQDNEIIRVSVAVLVRWLYKIDQTLHRPPMERYLFP